MAFSSRKPDWALIPIAPDERWSRHTDPRPNFVDLTNTIIELSGRADGDIDKLKLLTGLLNVFSAQATAYLGPSIPQFEANLDKVLGRDDFTVDMPWDFLTHFEAKGVAAYNLLVGDLTDESFISGLAAAARDGSFDL